MRKSLCVLLLAGLAGCYVPAYAVRRVVAPADPPLSREEVERLASAGVSEPVLLELVEKRGSVRLAPDDLVALKKAGVGDPVVQKMIASERQQPAQVAVDEYYVSPSYYYYDYPYYHYGYGFGWGWGWGYPRYYYPRATVGVRVYR